MKEKVKRELEMVKASVNKLHEDGLRAYPLNYESKLEGYGNNRYIAW